MLVHEHSKGKQIPFRKDNRDLHRKSTRRLLHRVNDELQVQDDGSIKLVIRSPKYKGGHVND